MGGGIRRSTGPLSVSRLLFITNNAQHTHSAEKNNRQQADVLQSKRSSATERCVVKVIRTFLRKALGPFPLKVKIVATLKYRNKQIFTVTHVIGPA